MFVSKIGDHRFLGNLINHRDGQHSKESKMSLGEGRWLIHSCKLETKNSQLLTIDILTKYILYLQIQDDFVQINLTATNRNIKRPLSQISTSVSFARLHQDDYTQGPML